MLARAPPQQPAPRAALRRQPALGKLQARFAASGRRRVHRQESSIASITDLLADDDDAIVACAYPYGGLHARAGSDGSEAAFVDLAVGPEPKDAPSPAAAVAHKLNEDAFQASWYTPTRTTLRPAQLAQYAALGRGRPPLQRASFLPLAVARPASPVEVELGHGSLARWREAQYKALGHGRPPLGRARFVPVGIC